jgi:hypothetical protein
MPKRIIFREKALQQYIQRKEKTVLPLWISPPIFLFLWFLLGQILLIGLVAWFTEVPVISRGNGIIIVDQQQNTAPTALIFLPISHPITLQAGTSVRFEIEEGTMMSAHISSVVPHIVSPNDARQQFSLGDDPCQLSQGPAVVLTVELDTPPVKTINGSCIKDVPVQTGTRKLSSLLLEAVL